MDKISKKLGNNIKRIRIGKGMSQGDVCRATGMDRGYISRVESGFKNPTVSNLEKIAKAHHVGQSRTNFFQQEK